MENPNNSKFDEAKRLISDWHRNKNWYVVPDNIEPEIIDKILAAQDLLSYERGRAEAKKEIKEFLSTASVWGSEYIYERKVRMLEVFDKKFNPEAQQALKSDNQNAV